MTEFKKTIIRATKKAVYPATVICIASASIASASEVGILGGDDGGIGCEIDKDNCEMVVSPQEHYYEPHPHIHTSGTHITAIRGAPTTYETTKSAYY